MNKLNRPTFELLLKRQALKKLKSERAAEATSLEPLVLCALARYQDDHGRVSAVYYKDICEQTGISPASFYSTLESLSKPMTGILNTKSLPCTVPALIRVSDNVYSNSSSRGEKIVEIINNVNAYEVKERPESITQQDWAKSSMYMTIDDSIITLLRRFKTTIDKYHILGKFKGGREMLLALDLLNNLKTSGRQAQKRNSASVSYSISVKSFEDRWKRDLNICGQTLKTYVSDITKVFATLNLKMYYTVKGKLLRIDPAPNDPFYINLMESETNEAQEYRKNCAEKSVRQLDLDKQFEEYNKNQQPDYRFTRNRIAAVKTELAHAIADYHFDSKRDHRDEKKKQIIQSEKIPEIIDQVSLGSYLLRRILTQHGIERLQRTITPAFLQQEFDQMLTSLSLSLSLA